MKSLLSNKTLVLPVLVVAVIIAVGASGIILLTGDETSGGSSGMASGSSAAAGGGGAGAVDIIDFKFDPEPIEVPVGTEVTWTNEDASNHTATADDDSFDTGNLAQGDSGSATFDTAGEFTYFCAVHPFMKGNVVVK